MSVSHSHLTNLKLFLLSPRFDGLHAEIESQISLNKEIYKLYANATNTNLKDVMRLYTTDCTSHEKITKKL